MGLLTESSADVKLRYLGALLLANGGEKCQARRRRSRTRPRPAGTNTPGERSRKTGLCIVSRCTFPLTIFHHPSFTLTTTSRPPPVYESEASFVTPGARGSGGRGSGVGGGGVVVVVGNREKAPRRHQHSKNSFPRRA